MPSIRSRSIASVLTLAAAAAFVLPACGLNLSLNAEAKDQWKKTYTLAAGGTFEIHNTNGQIDIQPADGTTVDVVADRVAKAATDEGANDALRRIEINETVSPDHVTLDSDRRGHATWRSTSSRRVDFVVTLPKGVTSSWCRPTATSQITDVTGTFDVETTNGRIKAESLGNGISVATHERRDLARLREARRPRHHVRDDQRRDRRHRFRKTAKRSISARVTNGAIATERPEPQRRPSNRTTPPRRVDLAEAAPRFVWIRRTG